MADETKTQAAQAVEDALLPAPAVADAAPEAEPEKIVGFPSRSGVKPVFGSIAEGK